MAVPDFQSLFKPLLELAANGKVPLDDLNYKSLWVRCMENVLKRVYLILASIWLVTIRTLTSL